jgi:acyl-CoA thioester hydrolase
MTGPDQAHAYLSWARETIRYADTDRQGHVNNAVFAILLETGRVMILYSAERPILEPGSAFVIARLVLDFEAELTWPGEVHIGTRVADIGRSSVKLEQTILQNGPCCGLAKTVIVLMDEATRKSRPLSSAAVARLKELQLGAQNNSGSCREKGCENMSPLRVPTDIEPTGH